MTSPKPLNILYLHSHDTGRYIQPYGYPARTPHLQKLAEEGMLFRNAFCAAPTCSPSRAALLTGQWAHSCGMLGLAHRGFRLIDNSRYLAEFLRSQGYATVLSAPPAQHVVGNDETSKVGYERILSEEADSDESLRTPVDACLRFLQEKRDKPFFLDFGWGECHRPFAPPEPPEDARYTRAPEPLPDTPETRADMAAFYSEARRQDAAMGRVLEELERQGLADSTLVIATTDHGIPFPRMKCHLEDSGIGVYLILRGPAGSDFRGGKTTDALVSHIDVFPTICELASLAPPGWLQGRSLVPLADGSSSSIRQEVFSEVNYHAAYEPQRCIRTDRWKYIHRFDPRGHPILPNCDGSPSKDFLLSHGWQKRAPYPEALYDLVFDPNETKNLIAEPSCQTELEELRARLEAWMKETQDPLLSGPVPAPPGTRLADPAALSNVGTKSKP